MLVTAAVLALAQGTNERHVFELTAEAPDAQKAGAPEVDEAQKLAKSGKLDEAARKLEALSKRLPASVHDCNLALAYLRASNVTAAKLAHDLSALRNGARPKWCTGDVSTQLSDALRVGRFVPTALEIMPADALVEVNGIQLRALGTVWLPPQPHVFTVTAPGRVAQTVTYTVAGPNARFALTLEAPQPVQSSDAGVPEPMAAPDAAIAVFVPPVEAPVPQMLPPQDDNALIKIGGSPVGYRAASLTLAIVGWIGAGVFGYLTYDAKQRANERYTSDPEFTRSEYDGYAITTISAVALGGVATAFYIYFLAQGDAIIQKPGKIRVGVGDSGGFIGYGGAW